MDHYAPLDHEPTREYHQHINLVVLKAAKLYTVDGEVKNALITKHPAIASFYELAKLHKKERYKTSE